MTHLTPAIISGSTLAVLLVILIRFRLAERRRRQLDRMRDYSHFHDAPR